MQHAHGDMSSRQRIRQMQRSIELEEVKLLCNPYLHIATSLAVHSSLSC
jgi:hypothetical protein